MSESMIMYDVVVAGGGPAGIGAAIGAGRSGKTVAIIERHPYVGGMGTAALVNNFCNAHKGHGNRMLIGGVFQQLRQRLIDRKAIYGVYPWCWMESYDPKVFIEEANAMMKLWNITPYLGQKWGQAPFSCLATSLVARAAAGKRVQAPSKDRLQFADESVAPQRAAAMCLRTDLGEKRLALGHRQLRAPVAGRMPPPPRCKVEQAGDDWGMNQPLIVADGLIFALTKRGDLVLIESNQTGYKELGRVATKIKLGIPQQPTIANDRLYVRGDTTIVCYQVARK
jgi:hypothetical protein